MSESKGFRVVIVGAGIAGLSLANTLQAAKIDFIMLESRNEIAPQVGASIGMMPNGSRILDQLGLFDEFYSGVEPLKYEANRNFDGSLIGPKLSTGLLVRSRSGYDIAFGDRQFLLQILYKNIVDKSKLLLNKRVSRIEDTAEGARVVCVDGSSYEGDVIAGADGVYSRVRQEMWRLADAGEPGLIPEKEKKCMSASYKCLYGIFGATPGFDMTGEINANFTKDSGILCLGGTDRRAYVFLSSKLDKTYHVPNIPKYSDKDAEEYVREHAGAQLLPGHTLGKLWENRLSYKLVPLEEADFKTWTYGRIACLGDNIHKMTPHAGQGGNSALEDAAVITNILKKLVDNTTGKPTKDQVTKSLKQYQKLREVRMHPILATCNELTRIQTLSNLFHTLLVHYIVCRVGDAFMDMHANLMIGAAKLDFLPPPKRSIESNMPFNPLQGEGYKESKIKRALYAFPFIALFYLAAFRYMDLSLAADFTLARVQSGKTEWGSNSVPLLFSFYNIKWLDDLWSQIVPFFMPSLYGADAVTRWQGRSFLVDLGPILAIFYTESSRRSNALSFARFPFVLAMVAQFVGIGALIHIYFFLHYIFTPIAAFRSTDLRLTRIAYTRTILPALLVVYYIPTFVQYLHPSLPARQSWNWVWQMYPVWVSASTWALKKLFFTDTIAEDKLWNTKRDYSTIQYTVGATAAISAATWLHLLTFSPFSLTQLFVPSMPLAQTQNLEDFNSVFLKLDQLFAFGSSFLWLALLFWDMKAAGMVRVGWASLLASLVVSLFAVGPGATLALGWLWRESVITHKRHKGAVIETWEVEERERRDSGTEETTNGEKK